MTKVKDKTGKKMKKLSNRMEELIAVGVEETTLQKFADMFCDLNPQFTYSDIEKYIEQGGDAVIKEEYTAKKKDIKKAFEEACKNRARKDDDKAVLVVEEKNETEKEPKPIEVDDDVVVGKLIRISDFLGEDDEVEEKKPEPDSDYVRDILETAENKMNKLFGEFLNEDKPGKEIMFKLMTYSAILECKNIFNAIYEIYSEVSGIDIDQSEVYSLVSAKRDKLIADVAKDQFNRIGKLIQKKIA
ncbi:MAG: hypothetical protein PHF63_00310 [Herbinix sp.]|nr:hypothetical protein [Herbinix sp.]